MKTLKRLPSTQKRTYAKPRIERVRLVPQESVLSVCKGVGKYGALATTGCQLPPPSACYAQGS
jgi:hypothetical protein